MKKLEVCVELAEVYAKKGDLRGALNTLKRIDIQLVKFVEPHLIFRYYMNQGIWAYTLAEPQNAYASFLAAEHVSKGCKIEDQDRRQLYAYLYHLTPETNLRRKEFREKMCQYLEPGCGPYDGETFDQYVQKVLAN